MTVKAIKHPTDEGKWMSNFDEYGHGEGNGKSRNAVYKHFRKLERESKKDETVKDESDGWIDTEWMNDDSSEVKPKSIPEPLSDMVDGKFSEVNMKAQGHVVRTAFVGLDRLITHWGRGVMSNDEWSIERSPEDYDTLEHSTLQMLAYYDVTIPITPPMIWGLTVSTAYAKPISHVLKNRDPNKKRKGLFSRLFRRKQKPKKESEDDEEMSV